MSFNPLQTKDLLTLTQLSVGELNMLLDTAAAIKQDYRPVRRALEDKTLVLLFEKPSLRTRVSFDIGMTRLGGSAVYLDHRQERIGERESIADYGRNLERWTDAIVARTFSQATLDQLSASTRIPVINALSDTFHPCQALADLFTLREHFEHLAGLRLAYVGDGNNVCHSLMLACAPLGVCMTVITPSGFEPDAKIVQLAQSHTAPDATIAITNTMDAAVDHDAIYTDTWTSMGQEDERAKRLQVFSPFQVNASVMQRAASHAIFMHCLPAHRGEEVTEDVIDSPKSVVFDQAENRMHAQNAVLLHLLGETVNRSTNPSELVDAVPSM